MITSKEFVGASLIGTVVGLGFYATIDLYNKLGVTPDEANQNVEECAQKLGAVSTKAAQLPAECKDYATSIPVAVYEIPSKQDFLDEHLIPDDQKRRSEQILIGTSIILGIAVTGYSYMTLTGNKPARY